ncbi:ABC-2 transporter permease [Paenibacillus sp. FSL R5-0912]|uniref:ABC-2 transporter permease n=2 Tax=unclassified Paenibacillus TaxID=185978 RepID=UPI0004F82367|nr:ABC-2 transporter permease [Paenibacillus sp. FSL R5-0912]AIQ39448.1 hypothetical protein R50912_04930 [Paenibacillus sp. FSL R5-0912]
MKKAILMTRLDLLTTKSSMGANISLLVPVLLLAYLNSPSWVIYMTCGWFAALTSVNIFALEEKSNLRQLYGTLPIGWRNVVLGRYLYFLLLYVSFLIIVVPLYSILLLVNERALELDLINGLCASLVLFSVIISMQLPIYFKLGHSKGRYWSLVPFIGALVAVMVFFYFFPLENVIGFSRRNTVYFIIGGFLLAAGLLFSSYRLSARFYRKSGM